MKGGYRVDSGLHGWIDGVKVAVGNNGMTVEAARQWEKDQE